MPIWGDGADGSVALNRSGIIVHDFKSRHNYRPFAIFKHACFHISARQPNSVFFELFCRITKNRPIFGAGADGLTKVTTDTTDCNS